MLLGRTLTLSPLLLLLGVTGTAVAGPAAPKAPPPRPPPAVRAAPKLAPALAPHTTPVAPVNVRRPTTELAPPPLVRARARAARGEDVMQLIQDFPKDRELAISAIATNEEAFKFVDGRLRRDRSFLRAAAVANPHLVMPESQEPWAKASLEAVLTPGTREALLADPEVAAAVGATRARLAKVPDLRADIFSMNRRFFEEIVKNRLDPREGDDRPIAVVAYPTADHNGQFFDRTDQLEALTKRYRVMFYQVDSDTAFVSAVADGTKHKPAALVVIAGHGESALAAFGAEDPAKLPERMRAQLDAPDTSPRVRQRILDRIAKLNEERYLDLSDRAQLEKVADRVAKGGSILLISCSTGKGGAKATNLANFLHEVFPQARIDAPTEPVPNLGLKLDPKGLYEDAGFADIGKRYRIEPR
jgi:hypothetical protein